MFAVVRVSVIFAVVTAFAVVKTEAVTFVDRRGKTYNVDAKTGSLLEKAAAADAAKDKRQAISYLAAALETKPDNAVAAAIYEVRGGEGGGRCRSGDSIEPAPRVRLSTRGRACRRRGQHKAAIEAYNKGIDLDPGFAQLYVNRAVAYIEAGDYERALRDANEAIRRAPNLGDAYVNGGAVYHGLQQYDKATRDYDKGISLSPRSADAHFNRSLSFLKTGRRDFALRDLSSAIGIDPAIPSGQAGNALH